MVAGWHLDAASDDTLTDFTGNGHDAAISGDGASIVSGIGPVKKASYTADATSGYLTLGTHTITAQYAHGTSDPYANSTSAELDQEVDPDFAVTGPAAAVTSASGLTYMAQILPDAANDAPSSTFSFTLNGATYGPYSLVDGAKTLTVTAPSAAGTYPLTITYNSGDSHYAACTLTRTLVVVSSAPSINQPANVSTSGATANLSIPDPSGGTSVIYDWTIDGTDLPMPTFSPNDTHDASTTTATFSQAGVYTVRATAANPAGLTATTTFTVTVSATATEISIDPPPMAVPHNGDQQFTATVLDQFGNPLAMHPSITWSATTGTFTGSVYTAPSSGSGDTICATSSSVTGSIDIPLGTSPISAAGAATFRRNMPYMLYLASAGLHGNPITSWSINWGDNSGTQTISGNPLPAAVPHVYTAAGPFTIGVGGSNSGHTYNVYANGDVAVTSDAATTALPLSGGSFVFAGNTYTLTLGSPLPPGEGQGVGILGSGTDVSYTINWNDGSNATVINADDLAAAGDQVTHVFNASTWSPISVDLTVDGNTYYSVGSLAVTVSTDPVTTTSLSLDSPSPNFGDRVTLTAAVTSNMYSIVIPTGTVDFYASTTNGTMYLGAETLDGSDMATFTTPPLANGDYSFTAVYHGDNTFLTGTSNAATGSVSNDPASGTPAITGSSSASEGSYTLGLPTSVGNHSITDWGIDWGDGTTST
jgi:hypothetical protein